MNVFCFVCGLWCGVGVGDVGVTQGDDDDDGVGQVPYDEEDDEDDNEVSRG